MSKIKKPEDFRLKHLSATCSDAFRDEEYFAENGKDIDAAICVNEIELSPLEARNLANFLTNAAFWLEDLERTGKHRLVGK